LYKINLVYINIVNPADTWAETMQTIETSIYAFHFVFFLEQPIRRYQP